jgi:hypothetical protein
LCARSSCAHSNSAEVESYDIVASRSPRLLACPSPLAQENGNLRGLHSGENTRRKEDRFAAETLASSV